MQFHFELCRFAGQFFAAVAFREGDVDHFFVARFHTDDLLFEARDELAAADVERELFRFAAFEGFAVEEPFEIDDGSVAAFNGAVLFDVNERGLRFRSYNFV